MGLDRRVFSLKKHIFYFYFFLQLLTSSATSKFAARQTKLRQNYVALFRLPTMHQMRPHTIHVLILYLQWFAPLPIVFDVQTVNLNSYRSQDTTTCATGPTSFSQSFFSHTGSYYTHALLVVVEATLKQCAHISIVDCLTPRMMVVVWRSKK